ncbi:Alpha/Beta hydrolase protein [Leucosporidium creatinivorum]|uniref:Alpha/Beta hydrolase protein n=1 Tax=Leucosporidium creatinivorum TaxID=106004 RepID=A0A1Y2EII5_9BASI|nr:Alpha/Beta hydrolase protein [Leucosporidium creatinivorum]
MSARPLATIPPSKIKLGLATAAPPQTVSTFQALHFAFALVLPFVVSLPFKLVKEYVLARWWSPYVAIGRSPKAHAGALFSAHFFGRCSTSQSRLVFNHEAYAGIFSKTLSRLGLPSDWVQHVDSKGTTGFWMAPPGTKRSEDDLVMLYIHGGGFTLDCGGGGLPFHLELAKKLNLDQGLQYSVFHLDYQLAPEFRYPSQLIETLAAYHYLVNTLGISEDRIVLAGDSAGGNLATAFLLHLARPNPAIKVPAELGPTPRRPAAAILISPFNNLVSFTPSRSSNAAYDIIDDGSCFQAALKYVNAPVPASCRSAPSLNPFHLARGFPNAPPPWDFPFITETRPFEAEEEGSGTKLMSSPYVNPSRCKDLEWWKSAMPGEGKTLVTWGGKEIFADDDEEMFGVLEKAGVAPSKLYKDLGAHDWVIFDSSMPEMWKTASKGPDNYREYGVDSVAGFLFKHFGNSASSVKRSGEGVIPESTVRRRA